MYKYEAVSKALIFKNPVIASGSCRIGIFVFNLRGTKWQQMLKPVTNVAIPEATTQ
ncbi:hypothetical protein [Gaoshiqia sp. Z1-71]|uniref:hypothetical protein n=1 Tax=Gaoshiqia hydrogeniformans TaxID=3290090 RepID=UPI003BF89FC1